MEEEFVVDGEEEDLLGAIEVEEEAAVMANEDEAQSGGAEVSSPVTTTPASLSFSSSVAVRVSVTGQDGCISRALSPRFLDYARNVVSN